MDFLLYIWFVIFSLLAFIMNPIVLITLFVAWCIWGYNKLVKLKALVDEAWRGIYVQLKRRYDIIPNLVTVVKQYDIHEREILEQVAHFRSVAINAQSVEQKAEAEEQLTSALRTLFTVVENYPELKANENFLRLQQDLNHNEYELQLARRYYNVSVHNYNSVLDVFPTNIIASLARFERAEYFEITNAAEHKASQVRSNSERACDEK